MPNDVRERRHPSLNVCRPLHDQFDAGDRALRELAKQFREHVYDVFLIATRSCHVHQLSLSHEQFSPDEHQPRTERQERPLRVAAAGARLDSIAADVAVVWSEFNARR